MSIGVWQVVIVLVIILIIFGAGKLPHVMGDVAKGIKNFKSGLSEDDKQDTSSVTDKGRPSDPADTADATRNQDGPNRG